MGNGSRTERACRPLQAAAYLVVLKEQNPDLLKEFRFSFASLRRFHPGLPVYLYHQNLERDQLAELRRLPGLLDFPIAVDHTGRFAQYGHRNARTKVLFPELDVIAAKIDVLLLSPGDTLFLDTDTEVKEPLADCFRSPDPWMHFSEGPLTEHERDFAACLEGLDWAAWGWPEGAERLQVFNSGALWVPQALKLHLYRAKELLWYLAAIPGNRRHTNRLDEQLALSVALQEVPGRVVREIGGRVNHYFAEKYARRGPTYDRVYGPEGNTVFDLPATRYVPGTTVETRCPT